MIRAIRLHGLATYSNPVEIFPHKINFIYGGNGVGKSTLTRFLSGDISGPACSIDWHTSAHEKIVVYNKQFVERNFSAETGLPGIFTLGEQSIEIKEEISRLRTTVDNATQEKEKDIRSQQSLREDISAHKASVIDTCWTVQTQYGHEFTTALTGFRGSKDKFGLKCIDIVTNNPDIQTVDLDELRRLYATAYAKEIESLPRYQLIEVSPIQLLESNTLLSKVITGKSDTPIGTFIEYLQAADWIKRGTSFIKRANGKCPFCQQPLPESIAADIESFFDETYARDIADLDAYFRSYTQTFNGVLDRIKAITDARIPLLDYSDIDSVQRELALVFEKNCAEIRRKMESPSIVITIDTTLPLIERLNEILSNLNTQIDTNNAIIADQKKAKETCQRQVWLFLANKVKNEVRAYLKDAAGKQRGIDSLENKISARRKQIEQLTSEIAEKESQLTSVVPTVNAINGILDKFGFLGFSLAADPRRQGTYQIIRSDGSDASKTLSEGEYTFISFLYFYHLCFGSHEGSGLFQNKILVIDDPISSLDSSVLFVVATLVKDIIAKCRKDEFGIKQVIILTHNIHFHKEITYLGSRDHFSPSEVQYYIIRKKDEISGIDVYTENPIRTSYELLWDEIKDSSHYSCKGIFNAMRRILEHYFQIIGGINYEDCISRFDGEDKLICKSLVAYINDGSHSIFDEVMICLDESTIDKYKRVFALIFEKLNHKDHYNMMMNRGQVNN